MEERIMDQMIEDDVLRASPDPSRDNARRRFAQAVAAIAAQDRFPHVSDGASDIDLCEMATTLISQT